MVCEGKGSTAPHGQFKVGGIVDREATLAGKGRRVSANVLRGFIIKGNGKWGDQT